MEYQARERIMGADVPQRALSRLKEGVGILAFGSGRQESRQDGGDFISDSVMPIVHAGQAEFIDDKHGFSECIGIEPAHGHTPGQFLVRIRGEREEAVLSADLMHTPLQLRYPQWSTNFCVDPDLARRTREDFLNSNCNGPLVFPAHFPSPCGGRIFRDGSHYFFEYV